MNLSFLDSRSHIVGQDDDVPWSTSDLIFTTVVGVCLFCSPIIDTSSYTF